MKNASLTANCKIFLNLSFDREKKETLLNKIECVQILIVSSKGISAKRDWISKLAITKPFALSNFEISSANEKESLTLNHYESNILNDGLRILSNHNHKFQLKIRWDDKNCVFSEVRRECPA